LLYDSLFDSNINDIKHKHLWVKKSAGLGVTEFFLRLMVWLCLRNDAYKNSQMCIVTGPNIDIAIKLIKRMKALFEAKIGVTFDSKETVLILNGCTIEAYRALDNPKFILIDESDFCMPDWQFENLNKNIAVYLSSLEGKGDKNNVP
jgi:late competence protein required for DNA uptake (superfamily II DNA/RNA helicase)